MKRKQKIRITLACLAFVALVIGGCIWGIEDAARKRERWLWVPPTIKEQLELYDRTTLTPVDDRDLGFVNYDTFHCYSYREDLELSVLARIDSSGAWRPLPLTEATYMEACQNLNWPADQLEALREAGCLNPDARGRWYFSRTILEDAYYSNSYTLILLLTDANELIYVDGAD